MLVQDDILGLDSLVCEDRDRTTWELVQHLVMGIGEPVMLNVIPEYDLPEVLIVLNK